MLACSKCETNPVKSRRNWCSPCQTISKREYRKNNPEKFREMNRKRMRKYREKHTRVIAATNIINWFIKGEYMVREPCEICADPNSHGHHDDYDKPLEVRWLCPSHHSKWHKENGPGLNR